MKLTLRIFTFLYALCTSICISNKADAQLLDRLKNTVKQTAEDRANDAAASETNKAIDKSTSGTKGKKTKKSSSRNDENASSDGSSQTAPAAADSKKLQAYQNYDFVAGDKIVFDDNLSSDQDGEFPAHWELKKGQAVTNLQQGKKAFVFTEGNYVVVSPRITGKNYLGNEFTIEFDTYAVAGASAFMVFFHIAGTEYDSDAQIGFNTDDVQYYRDDNAKPVDLHGKMPSALSGDAYENKWHHIALGYKNRQLKIYIDQYRVLTVPDCGIDPARISLAGAASEDAPQIVTNVKIAQGGSQNMIGNILTNGKFITHGITFDVDKAILKPESMGVINQIYNFLKSNAAVKLEIDGHTDNTGTSAHNMILSQQRADAVKTQLVNMGIDGSRLTTKGLGDSKPLSNNNTPEGKANNRRVELIKL
jgi:outer membrane protein OmpA-like peptidoglycan-associated protein